MEQLKKKQIAYFTMEIALSEEIQTYSGGLGVLAGDTARSAADLAVPMVVVSLMYHKGYFRQKLDSKGKQVEEDAVWDHQRYLEDTEARAVVEIAGRSVEIKAWRYNVVGESGAKVPVFLLDADLDVNSAEDRKLTDHLYGGDECYRICQEVILGIGGIRILRALGYDHFHRYHMNEGHASFLTLELLDEELQKNNRSKVSVREIQAVRKKCVFTTHTPVEAGHDAFSRSMVNEILGSRPEFEAQGSIWSGDVCNMTYLGFNMSSYINGVARKHGEVSRELFGNYCIDSITNGVHIGTFVSKPVAKLFDEFIPSWRSDNFSLRYAMSIPHHRLWETHTECKQMLLDFIERREDVKLDPSVMTIGFARRVAAYKRADLMFWDIRRLIEIAEKTGPFQIVYAGKAHPRDSHGKKLIERVYAAKEALQGKVEVIYLENYDLEIGKLITAGVDVWLNNPQPPMEASGTSGMKSAANGVPSLSVLDGWWIEGWIEGVTGWAIQASEGTAIPAHDTAAENTALYDKLENNILPMFYRDRVRFIDIMRHSIALNGSFFNTERMVKEYVLKAYFV